VSEELWNAVQATLSANLTRRRQARVESGALLQGLIFDDRSNRMSPTYTMRRKNRFRYYISQACLRGGEVGSRPRISADDVERLVVEELRRQQKRSDPRVPAPEIEALVLDGVRKHLASTCVYRKPKSERSGDPSPRKRSNCCVAAKCSAGRLQNAQPDPDQKRRSAGQRRGTPLGTPAPARANNSRRKIHANDLDWPMDSSPKNRGV